MPRCRRRLSGTTGFFFRFSWRHPTSSKVLVHGIPCLLFLSPLLLLNLAPKFRRGLSGTIYLPGQQREKIKASDNVHTWVRRGKFRLNISKVLRLGLYRTSLSGPEVRQISKVRTQQKPDVLLPGHRTFITWKNGEKIHKKKQKKKISKFFFKIFFKIFFFLFIYLVWEILTPNLCSGTLYYEK